MITKKQEITAIVPCYNEEKNIYEVLKTLTNSFYIDEVIVVNDGSTDKSLEVINKFKNIKLLNFEKNIGKGGSLKKGLEMVATPIVFICDADLKGLNDNNITKLIEPVLSGNYDLCVGITYKGGKILQYLRRNVLPLLAGQRVIKTEVLRTIINSRFAQEWGIEIYMNYFFKKNASLKMTKVDLEGVSDVLNIKKRGFRQYFKRLFKFLVIYKNILLLTFGIEKEEE